MLLQSLHPVQQSFVQREPLGNCPLTCTESARRRQGVRSGGVIVRASIGPQKVVRVVRGKCFVTRDVSSGTCPKMLAGKHITQCSSVDSMVYLQNIDTDQIIPAEYLTLVPSKVIASSLLLSNQMRCFFYINEISSCLACSQTNMRSWAAMP